MPTPIPFVPPPTGGVQRLVFHRGETTAFDGAQTIVWRPKVWTDADIQPVGNVRRTIIAALEAYETFYSVTVRWCPGNESKPDIQTKDRVLINGQVAEVLNVDDWATYLDVAVATMRNSNPVELAYAP